jgi:hypothetical protein
MAKRTKRADRPEDMVRSMDAGTLPACSAQDMLLAERRGMADLMNAVVDAVWVDDPLLAGKDHGKDAVKALIGEGCRLKYAYAQRLAEAAEDAVRNVRKQYLGRFRGCMAHVGDVLDRPGEDDRTRSMVPVGVDVTDADMGALKALSADGSWLTAARELATGSRPRGLSDAQVAVLAECRRFALSRYGKPDFAAVGSKATDDHVVQLRLEERMFLGWMNKGKAMFAKLNGDMKAAFDAGKPSFVWPLRLTDLHGRGGFDVPVTVAKTAWDKVRREQDATISGLSLEIGADTVRVRATLRLPRRTPDAAKFARTRRARLDETDFQALADAMNAKTHLLGRDPGFVNTMSWTLVRRDTLITAEMLKAAAFMDKEQARAYLSGHCHDGSNVVFSKHVSGRNFTEHVADLAKAIDGYRSKIDKGYDKLKALKQCLAKPLGLGSVEDRVPGDTNHPDPFVRNLAGRFHRLLNRIRQLKALRRETYRRIDAVKRSWFGWVTNVEAKLSVDFDAAVVREDAGFVTIPKDDPKYMGRRFNRLMNNGCRGRLERIASGKLEWLGVPEARLPSWYTSTTDWRHARVDAAQRNGEVFTSAVDGMVRHADEWASSLFAQFLLLREKAAVAAQ